jgi:elongation factor Ts
MATADAVKKLRDQTGVSVMQCKSALEESGGDFGKALEVLKKRGSAIAAKKGDRRLGAGAVSAYVHANREVGSMVILRSETDFVAKNEEFLALAKELAMQVAAMDAEDVPALLKQAYIKDPEKTVKDLIDAAVQKFGERIEVEKFSRFSTR